MANLNEMTAKELKAMAKELHISNWWNLKKEVLIKKIEEVQSMTDEEKQEIADQKAKEDAALDEYTKNWRKYTKRYNPVEFMEKFRAGEIVLESDETEEAETTEELIAENLETETSEAEEQTEDTASEAPISTAEETSKKPKTNAKLNVKKSNLKLKELTYKGETKSIRVWAEEINMPWPTLYDRVNRNGWTVEDAIETPLGQRRPK